MVMQCDYSNLQHMYEELSGALKSMNSVRSKKAERYLKPKVSN